MSERLCRLTPLGPIASRLGGRGWPKGLHSDAQAEVQDASDSNSAGFSVLGGRTNGGLGANDDHQHDRVDHDHGCPSYHDHDHCHRHAPGRPRVLGAGEPGGHVRRPAGKGRHSHRRTVAAHYDDRAGHGTATAGDRSQDAGADRLAEDRRMATCARCARQDGRPLPFVLAAPSQRNVRTSADSLLRSTGRGTRWSAR